MAPISGGYTYMNWKIDMKIFAAFLTVLCITHPIFSQDTSSLRQIIYLYVGAGSLPFSKNIGIEKYDERTLGSPIKKTIGLGLALRWKEKWQLDAMIDISDINDREKAGYILTPDYNSMLLKNLYVNHRYPYFHSSLGLSYAVVNNKKLYIPLGLSVNYANIWISNMTFHFTENFYTPRPYDEQDLRLSWNGSGYHLDIGIKPWYQIDERYSIFSSATMNVMSSAKMNSPGRKFSALFPQGFKWELGIVFVLQDLKEPILLMRGD